MKVLKLEQVGINENFFELGGHSLLATQIISRVQLTFGLKVTLRNLFEAPTIAGFGEALAQLAGGPEPVEEIARTVRQIERLSTEDAASLLQRLQNER
jgi:acyl carrier protein